MSSSWFSARQEAHLMRFFIIIIAPPHTLLASFPIMVIRSEFSLPLPASRPPYSCTFLSNVIFSFLAFITLTTSSFRYHLSSLSLSLLLILHYSFLYNFLCLPSMTLLLIFSFLFSPSPCPPLFPPSHPSSTLLFGRTYSIEIAPQCRDWGENKPVAPEHFSHTQHISFAATLPLAPATPNLSHLLSPWLCASVSFSLSLPLNFPVKGQYNYSYRNVSVLMHKMKLIQAHTFTHLHT